MTVLAPPPVDSLIYIPPNQNNINLLFERLAFFIDRYIDKWDFEFQKLHRELIPPTFLFPVIETFFKDLIESFDDETSFLISELKRNSGINSIVFVSWFLHHIERESLAFMENVAQVFDDEHTHRMLSIFFEKISVEGNRLLEEVLELIEDSFVPGVPEQRYGSTPS